MGHWFCDRALVSASECRDAFYHISFRERTRQVSLRQGYRYHFVFTFERTEVDVEYRLFLENNDSQLIFMRFRNPAPGIWRINVEPIQMSEGEYHMWLPMEEFLSGEVYFLEANPDNTLTEPGTSRHAMTVAYYNSDDNAVDINSGEGILEMELLSRILQRRE